MDDELDPLTNRTARARLDYIIKDLVADQICLDKVLAFLFDNSSITYVVEWSVLASLGIYRTDIVSLSLREVPLRRALRIIFSQLQSRAADINYTVDDGVVIISTISDLNSGKYQTSHSFNIANLAAHRSYTAQTYEERVGELLDAVELTISPESWMDQGGTIGHAHEIDGQLIVHQTRDNQLRIQKFLRMLETNLDNKSVQKTTAQVNSTDGHKSKRSNHGATVFFLSADPRDQTGLRVPKELRSIQERIRATSHETKISLVSEWATRPKDIQAAILRWAPDVLHISGHGARNGDIVFEDEDGNSTLITLAALGNAIRAIAKNIRLVVLNCCYSGTNAQSLADSIRGCVVAMRDAVDDTAAIVFAAALYQALAFGCDIESAFNAGKAEIALHGFDGDQIPELFYKQGLRLDALLVDEGL